MNTGLLDHDVTHPMGDLAMHPIAQPWHALTVLFLLAGRSHCATSCAMSVALTLLVPMKHGGCLGQVVGRKRRLEC
jgi:hypothetical protein